MYGGGRERKASKVTKRSQQAAAAAAAEAAADGAVGGSKRDKWLKVPGKQKQEGEDDNGPLGRRGAGWQPPQGEVTGSLGEHVFTRWEELLSSREELKRRLDAIAATHGWESRSARRSFLGGIEPGALVRSLRTEVAALDQASEELARAGLLLQLRDVRSQLEQAAEERERLTEDVAQLQEDKFEACALADAATGEVERLRQQAVETGSVGPSVPGGAGGSGPSFASSQPPPAETAASVDLSLFEGTLSPGQASEGRRVVEALERLKLPDEAAMGPRELACWRENKKTIVNSLRTPARSKWPSWRGQSGPPRDHQFASEGLGLPSALVTRGPASQKPPRGRGLPPRGDPS